MKPAHSPWPLFCDDLDFAQDWMRNQLNRFPMTMEAGHTALNIGLRYEVEQHLACHPKDDRVEQSSDDQFRFRLARMDGARNPYRELIPSCHHDNVCRFVAKAAQSKTPLAVHLFGGLGDQLELLSLVLPWSSRHSVPLRLFAEEQRCRLLAPCCLTTQALKLLIHTCSPFAQSMAIRLGVFEHDPTSRFTAWIQAEVHSRSAQDGLLLESGGARKFPLHTQPIGALSISAQLLPKPIGARTSNKNRGYHAMATMGDTTVPATRSHSPKPCCSGPDRVGQPVPGQSSSQHRHCPDPSVCSDGACS